ncbi:MAG: hypothetical protein HOO99_03860 [Hyphomicrobiaceae bacterium]|nr:hypothetical protein [Hyphomicrobiaceae bacterium]
MRQVIESHRGSDFLLGSADCATLFSNAVFAMTGFDPAEGCRNYSCPVSALRVLRARGFRSVLELVEANFVEIPVTLAQRGDLGFPEIPNGEPLMSPGVIDGPVAFSMNETGFVILPRQILQRAFAV